MRAGGGPPPLEMEGGGGKAKAPKIDSGEAKEMLYQLTTQLFKPRAGVFLCMCICINMPKNMYIYAYTPMHMHGYGYVHIHVYIQPIASGVSFYQILQSLSNWSLFIGTWQTRRRELDD